MQVFDKVPVKIPAKNVFNLSHDVKATYNFDKIYPFLCQPIYPGETWNCRLEAFLRTMPLLAPLMHNVDMHVWFFFVPNRLVWNENKKRDWKIFITGGEDGKQNPTLPYFTYKDFHFIGQLCNHGSLLDHMGFPTFENVNWDQVESQMPVNVLPFRAYQLIWNEYFRNQNVQNEIEFSMDEGHAVNSPDELHKLFDFRYKCYEKDYFTSCLPFMQRGEAVRLPVDIVPEMLNVDITKVVANSDQTHTERDIRIDPTTNNALFVGGDDTLSGRATLKGAPVGNIVRNGELVFAGLNVGTLNDFRYCLRLQQWLENNARCGSRYIEQLFAHFGVTSSDARLQRPELLGGGKIPIIFTDVEQTSFGEGESDNVLGDLAGKGTLYGKTDGFKKYFEEHGILLGLLSIIPRTSYGQGLPRVWTAMDKTDWYFPEFAHLGEQAVLNHEICYNPLDNSNQHNPLGVFGYQGRFTELRYIPSTFHGEFKTTLDFWHLGRKFPAVPTLNSNFVESHTRGNVWALKDVAESGFDPFVCQLHLDIKAVRPLPKFAVPTL